MELVPRRDLRLAISRATVRAQENRGFGRVDDRFETLVTLLIAGTHEQVLQPFAIDFDVPVDAARRAQLGFDDVHERDGRPGRRRAVFRESRNQPRLQPIERGDVERNGVVEDAGAATDDRASVRRSGEGEGSPRRHVEVTHDRFVVVPRAVLNRQPRRDRPRVLRVSAQGGLAAVERAASDESDLLDERAVFARDVDISASAEAIDGLVSDAGANLDEMQRSERREGVRVEPLRPPARSILIVEVAAGISIGREHHRRAALARINRRVELLHADARLEHTAAADDRLIRHARQHVVVPDVSGHGLRIERVQAGVSGLSRRHHRGSCEPVRARDHPIGARERFEALELRIALERRKTEYPRLAVLGLHRFEQADLPFHDRSAKI